MGSALGLQLDVEGRRKFYDAITSAMRGPRVPSRAESSPVLEVRLDRVAREVGRKLDRFGAWKTARVVTDEAVGGGEPVFPRSRLAVRHVGGMLLRGAPVKEVREDYPYLTDDDVEFAHVYAKAYPKVGRPRDRQAAAR